MASTVQGRQRDPIEAIEIADVFDQRAVAIEKDCGFHRRPLRAALEDRRDLDAAHAPVIERALPQHARPAPDGCVRTSSAGTPVPGAEVGDVGDVDRSSVGPNMAVTGMPTAAARCMAPESFVTSARQCRSTPASVGRSVRPTRSSSAAFRAAIAGLSRAFDVARRSPASAARADHDALHAVSQRGHRRAPQSIPAASASPRRTRRPAQAPRAAPSVPSGFHQQIQASFPRLARHRHTRFGRTARETEGAHEVLVVLDLMTAARRRNRARQQRAAPAGSIAPAFGDAGAARDNRRSRGVRQQQRGIEPPRRERRRLVIAESQRLVDIRRHREERRNRRAGRHRDRRRGRRAAHVRDRRQRHHSVAQPVRREDDQTVHVWYGEAFDDQHRPASVSGDARV